MGAFSIWHWIIVLIIVLLLFGKGKIPTLMGDMAKGIKSCDAHWSYVQTTEINLIGCNRSIPLI